MYCMFILYVCKVGLSGSSAIIVAAFRALMKFYGLTIADLRITQSGALVVIDYSPSIPFLMEHFFPLCMCVCDVFILEFPQVILDVERVELGIAAGLQDRVIQVYGGLVHMDFSAANAPAYTPLPTNLLPKMYLTYDTVTGLLAFQAFHA